MYKKHDKAQLTMDEFYLPFGDELDANNCWVKIARIILQGFIEEQYARNFSEESGRPSIPSCIAFGALFIKEQENLTDEGTVVYLCENPYAQYPVGLKAFRKEPLFDASMMSFLKLNVGRILGERTFREELLSHFFVFFSNFVL